MLSEQNQIQIKQNLQSMKDEKETNNELKEQLNCFESTVNNLREKLQLAEETREKEAEKISDLRHEYECNLGKLETEVDKWKLLHESLYLQYNRELRSWEDRLSSLENERTERESALEEEQRGGMHLLAFVLRHQTTSKRAKVSFFYDFWLAPPVSASLNKIP